MYGSSYAAALRAELSLRNREFARALMLSCCESFGNPPTVAYVPDPQRRTHGNFLPASYRSILDNPEWACRFNKHHAQCKALPRSDHGAWKELDSCNSSDALLMNVFCHPRTFTQKAVRALLNLTSAARPAFGVKARVPLDSGRTDQTEVDMVVEDLLVEAKLTESDFQCKPAAAVEQYRDVERVFDGALLPRAGEKYVSYQLIRNVLAAHDSGLRFCVLLDARRPDLIEAWHQIQRAVRPADLRVRCQILTWQELSGALPRAVQAFLLDKYGIAAD
jgi:hypothetical protein